MIREFSLLKGMPALLALVLLCPVSALAQAPDFIEFESGHVRPLAMSAASTARIRRSQAYLERATRSW